MKDKPIQPGNWRRKLFWVVLVLLVAGYIYGRPSLEKMLGVSLPALDNGRQSASPESPPSSGDITPADSEPAQPAADSFPADAAVKARPFELTAIGRNQFQSPGGLVYATGPGGEHRLDHVMRHGEDDTTRPVHSVFLGDRDAILQTIDEGYQFINRQPTRVKTKRQGDRSEYTIDMRRKIGFEGGQRGRRDGYPSLTKLKLVLQSGNQVVTAYPCR